MKKLKKLLILLIPIIMVMQNVLPVISYAVGEIKLNIQKERPYSDDDGDEVVGNDIYTLTRNAIQTIFKIGEQDNEGELNFNTAYAYYCLRAGLGFGSTEAIVETGVDYSVLAGLEDSNAIINYYKDTIGYDMPTQKYNAICWIADNMYLPKSQYAQELRADLMTKAEITESTVNNDYLTDDDIEVAQQMALWYFSNYDTNGNNSMSLSSSEKLDNLLMINEENENNNTSVAWNTNRAENVKKLYEYFVNSATEYANNYNESQESTACEITLDKTLAPTIEDKAIPNTPLNGKVVGPFKITATGDEDYKFTSNLMYKTAKDAGWSDIELNPTMGTVYISDENGEAIDNRTPEIEDMINQGEFYITVLNVPLNIVDITNFKLEIGYSYFETTGTMLVAEPDDQPVLKVEKEKIEETDYVEFEKVEDPEKIFDLALRKFITAIDGVTLTGENSRVPEVYLEDLRTGDATTATYEHSKNIITLKRGSKIVYTIRVYNEGELDGYATEVTDYLTEGLELVEDSEINAEYGWIADGNKVTTAYLADTVIKAYDEEMTQETASRENLVWQKAEDGTDGLYYADLQIECQIKDDVEVNTILPNIAEITGDLSEGEDTPDRDSAPESLEEDDIRNYDFTYPNSDYVEDDDDYERVQVEPDKVFDLALRKYITKVNGEEVELSREPQIDFSKLDVGTSTTAEYEHKKDPVVVKTGDIVTYKLTVYNEGEVAGRAKKIVDQLPTGLEFVEVVSGNYELENYDEDANKVTLKETANNIDLQPKEAERAPESTTVEINCEVVQRVSENDKVLTNVAWISEDYNEEGLEDRDSKPTINPDVNKNNMEDYRGKENKEDLSDKDYYYKGFEDDDDFEKLIIKGTYFDLALRKYIDGIERKGENVEFPSRVPAVDTSKLNNGTDTTATYTHPKDALTVKQGDIVTFKLRVYNEGELDGYATEIMDYIPEGLGFLNGYSKNSNWLIDSEPEQIKNKPLIGEDGWYKDEEDIPQDSILLEENLEEISIVTGAKTETGVELLRIKDYTTLKDTLIKGYKSEVEEGDKWQASINDENDGLFYEEVEVTCIVLAPNTWQEKIVNIAEISKDKAVDEDGEELDIEDRDSTPDNADLEDYELREDNSKYQEDDDDYEPIQLKYFDLALRKFITGVNEEQVDTRVPEFYIDEEGDYKYRHDKTPVEVLDKDNVTYTIRVFNEGSLSGYAEEVEDDVPEGLVFLPENEINQEYRWKMYRTVKENEDIADKNTVEKDGIVYVETENAEEAEIIRTDYLSEANGIIDNETGNNSNLLQYFDTETMETPDYKDLKVVFKVVQENIPEENEDRIITNKAHITEDSDDDEDSTPNEWNDGEDDQDTEKVYVKKFDLALFKWVTHTSVTVDGKTTITETGFKPNLGKTEQSGEEYRNNEEPEPIASVTLDKKKLKSTVVKFTYNIKVVNEGDIAGQATEITDYIPAGLKFEKADNPIWELVGADKITTKALDGVTLNPGESKVISVVFTWINDENNLGEKKNIAAITEDYNENGIKDEDSTPGNEDIPNYDKEQEDDDDFALVILTLKAGNEATYIGLIITVITILALGIITIKKYVL